jgi:lactobin A/cerein 7B family class IIb bacteriocin
MQELQKEEIEAVNGGILFIAAAAVVVLVTAGIGIYIGYQEAAAAANKK